MLVVFARTLHIGKKVYAAGQQDVPEAELRTKLMAKHIKAGHIMEASAAPKRTVVKSVKERAEGLLEKLHAGKAGKPGEAQPDAKSDEAPAPSESEASGEVADDSKPQGKSGKKNR